MHQKNWVGEEYIPTDIGMAAAIPAIPPATPLIWTQNDKNQLKMG